MKIPKTRKEYIEQGPIAVYSISIFSGIAIFDVLNDIEDYVVIARFYEKDYDRVRAKKVYYNTRGGYILYLGNKVYLDEFLKTGKGVK